MTYKEWTAAVQLTGAVLIAAWAAFNVLGDEARTVAGAAMALVWAIGVVIVYNIVAMILVTIAVSIANGGQELKDERADERDKAVAARSMRNAYVVVSVGGALTLALLAFGFPPVTGIHVLFATLMLGGATDALSRLVYYRLG